MSGRRKGGPPVYLTEEERRALNSWIRVRGKIPGPLFPGYGQTGIKRHALNRLMHIYGEIAELPPHKRHFHCQKHTCATMLLDAGVEIHQVQDHLGHADIGSTMVYAHVTEGQRQDVAERLERVVR